MELELLILTYAGLVGLAIGSFLNVVIFRYNSGRTLSGRSFCATCGHKLFWYDLMPLASFFLQGGKCRYCRARISWQYPFVEFLTACIFTLALAHFLQSPAGVERWLSFLANLIAWPLLLVIFVYDFRHKIVPDALVYGFIAVTLAFRLGESFLNGFSVYAWADLAAGPLLFLPFFLLWYLSKGKWMGLGDGKLALGLGWLLGLGGGISAVIFGFWLGALVGLFLMALARVRKGGPNFGMKTEIPFAPFLISGIFVVSFLNFSIFPSLYL